MKHKCYIVDITNLKDVDSLTDFMYILYNEYVLNSEYTFDEKLRVYTYNDSDEFKLKRALKKYKADKSYIDSIFKKDVKESSNIKLNNKPMKFSEYVKVSEGIDNRYEKNDVEYVEDYDEDYDEDYNEKDEKNFDDNILQNIADAINDLFIDGYVIDDTSDINDVINKVDTKLYFLYNTSLINYGIETVSDFCGVMNKINEKGLLNGNVDESVKENTKNKKINKMSDSKVRQSVMRESASDRYKSIIKKRHINESNMNIVQPKTKNELKSLIDKTIKEQGTACDLNFIDTSLITDMSFMFYHSLFNGDISSWNVSNVTNMDSMFYCSEFNGDISFWDVSNVTDMSYMFYNPKFNGDISSWNVSNVTDISGMFSDSKFNGNISSWDVSNVSDMSYIFSGSKFNRDISSWDVSNVTNMSGMFYNSEFNGDISSWDVSNVTNMSYMFYNSIFNGDISSWDVSNVTNMGAMFTDSKFNGDISSWNKMRDSKVRQSVMRESASDRYKSIIKKRHINESGFGDDVDNIKSPVGTYIHKTDRRVQPKTKNELQILIEETIKEEGAECDLNFIDTSLIKDMSYLFYGSDFNGDISQWDVSDVINMRYMFANSEFDGDISKWDIFNVEDMTGIFDSCEIRIKPDWFIEYESDYEDEEYFYNNKYNKKNYEVKKMRKNDFMDEGFDRYKSIIKKRHINESGFGDDVDNIKSPVGTYIYKTHGIVQPKTKKELMSLIDKTIEEQGYACDLNFIDTSLITDMNGMFYHSLFNGDISSWDVSNVTSMNGVFSNSLFNGDISSWDVSNVTDMSDMFSYSKFNGDISSWNVSKVTNMRCMFYDSIFNGNISSWNVSNVTNMRYMFTYSKFNGDISSWNVSNVTNMGSMFTNSKFNGNISSWDVSNVTDMSHMFDSCKIRIKPDWFIKFKKMRYMDEGFVYVKTDDLINEMKQEGVREYKEKNKIPSFKEGNIRYDGKTINTLNDSTIKETLSVVKNDIKTLISELSGKLSGISKYIKPEVIEEKVTKDYIKNKCDKAQCAECLDTLAELIKLKKVLYAIKRVILLRKEKANESVTSRFSVYGRVFESDDEDDKDTEDDDKDSKKDKDTEDDDKDSKKDKDTEDDEEETVNVTALKIVVDKDAVDKCKEDMIDYGVEEDDIEILDSEDTDENVTIKVDANSIDALRKFLDNKGIDLEEELGGSIEDEEDDKDGNEETDDEDKEDEEDEFDMSEFDNIFGDEEDEEEKGEDK